MVFMDEFLFFDPRALPVILPTLNNGASLVLTSSIAPNAATDLMRMLDARYPDGTRVVNVLNWIVSCTTCKKQGKADRCTHVNRRPQHFQKASHQERMRALMSIFPGSHERELLNIMDEPTRAPAFDGESINALSLESHTYRDESYVPRFFVCVDPNGGSFSSDMVITSCCYLNKGGDIYPVILGFECCSLGDNLTVAGLVCSHIEDVRLLPGLAHAMAVVVVESNMAGVATSVLHHMRERGVPNSIMMREDRVALEGAELRPGSRTTHKNKLIMIDMLSKYLKSRRILVHKNFVVSQPEMSMYPNMQKQMIEELRGFTRVTKVDARDVTKRPTFFYTGKLNGGRDDFVMSLAINIYHHSIFMTDDKYAMYRGH